MTRIVCCLLLFLLIPACQESASQTSTPIPATPQPEPSQVQPAPSEVRSSPSQGQTEQPITPTPGVYATTPTVEGIPQEIDSLIPPIPPSGVTATMTDGSVELKWRGTGSDILTYYVVYRRDSEDEPWKSLATVPIEGDNRGEYVFIDSSARGAEQHEYSVTAVDQNKKESDHSEIAKTTASGP